VLPLEAVDCVAAAVEALMDDDDDDDEVLPHAANAATATTGATVATTRRSGFTAPAPLTLGITSVTVAYPQYHYYGVSDSLTAIPVYQLTKRVYL
jgi:hypothetical protein